LARPIFCCNFWQWAGLLSAIVLALPAFQATAGATEPTHLPDAQRAPVAVAARIEQLGAISRLTVDLSARPLISANVLASPDRVVIDMPEVNFQIDPATVKTPSGASGGLIKAFRFGLFAAGKSRVVIDLTGPARIEKAEVVAVADGDPARLIVDLAKTDVASFRAAALQAAKLPSAVAAAPAPSKDPSTKPVIVIDPGHGGIDGGANGADGAVEKTVVFDFADALRKRLEAGGRYRVVMTRDGDVFVALGERVRIARESAAQLFVSVHADSLADKSDVTGATVYTASDQASDAEAARVAEKENAADAAAGLQADSDTNDVSDILFDLTRRETKTYSRLFSRTLVNYLKGSARLNKNPERAAGFKVLKAPDVPSVLLELGYLSSQKDIHSLVSPEWRDKATANVAQAIDSFFAPRLKPSPSQQSSDSHAEVATGALSAPLSSAAGGARLLPSQTFLRGSVAPAPH
jgi:N-acetylmuramoyl-L-alanine amidase